MAHSNPLTFVSIIVSRASGETFSTESNPTTSPALFTSTSIALNGDGRLVKAVEMAILSLTSRGSKKTEVEGYSAERRPCKLASRSERRALRRRWAP